ncbi:hypothetical protein JCM5353_001872 [Sporobolomyces roseus]
MTSPVSPTLQAYSDKVRFARRPSWTPEHLPHGQSKRPSIQARPSGLVLASPDDSSSSLHPSKQPTFHNQSSPMSPRSPSYPFPRVAALSRPQPFSAFSTDTTIRSLRRTESEGSVEMYTPGAGQIVESEERVLCEEEGNEDGLQRIFQLFDIQPSSCALLSPSSPTSNLPPALTPAASPSIDPISPLTLGTFAEPPSPLSPFGTFALLDILSPLPSPDLQEDPEELVSALVMEKFEEQGGFPWFSIEEGEHGKADGRVDGAGLVNRQGGEGEIQWDKEEKRIVQPDTPPTSPSTDRRPSNLAQVSSLPFHNLSIVPSKQCPRPPRPLRHRSSDDSWSPFPSTSSGSASAPPLPGLPPFASTLSTPVSLGYEKTRLRRSTLTIASIFATRPKPILERGRSHSLPTTPTTAPIPPPFTPRVRCCSIRRSLSRKRSTKSASRRPSQIRKSLISPPVPLPPLHIETSTHRPARPPPVSPLAQWRFPSSTTNPTSTSTSTSTSSPPSSHIDPLFSSPSNTSCSTSTSACITCYDTSEALKREQERGLALEGEVARLRKVVAVLIGDGSDSTSTTPE